MLERWVVCAKEAQACPPGSRLPSLQSRKPQVPSDCPGEPCALYLSVHSLPSPRSRMAPHSQTPFLSGRDIPGCPAPRNLTRVRFCAGRGLQPRASSLRSRLGLQGLRPLGPCAGALAAAGRALAAELRSGVFCRKNKSVCSFGFFKFFFILLSLP